MIGIGIALVPCKQDILRIRELTEQLEESKREFSFALHKRKDAIPHLSLLQGVFDDSSVAMEALTGLDPTAIHPILTVKNLNIWATNIVFLNFILSEELLELHNQICDRWFARSSRVSADPQHFTCITEGQRKSFEETGYPFSRQEFLPHITLAHLAVATPNAHSTVATPSTHATLPPSALPESITFEKIALFRVEPLGVLTETIAEWPLKLNEG